jgi:hypothetical protein
VQQYFDLLGDLTGLSRVLKTPNTLVEVAFLRTIGTTCRPAAFSCLTTRFPAAPLTRAAR